MPKANRYVEIVSLIGVLVIFFYTPHLGYGITFLSLIDNAYPVMKALFIIGVCLGIVAFFIKHYSGKSCKLPKIVFVFSNALLALAICYGVVVISYSLMRNGDFHFGSEIFPNIFSTTIYALFGGFFSSIGWSQLFKSGPAV